MRRFVLLLLSVLLALGATACGADPKPPSAKPTGLAADLSINYHRIGEEGADDQGLVIFNRASIPMVMTARFEALDGAGKVLDSVRTRSTKGTENGDQILMPDWNHDILRFDGPRAADVRDVRVVDLRVEPVDREVTNGSTVEAVAIGPSRGRELDYDFRDRMISVKVTNRYPGVGADAKVRVVLIAWDPPQVGKPRQPREVIRIGGLITVREGGYQTVVPTAAQFAKIHEYGYPRSITLQAFHSR